MNRTYRSVGFCEPCRKLMYANRKDAKAVARQREGHRPVERTHRSPYRCPDNDYYYHIGRVDPGVVSGLLTRDQVYGNQAA